LIFRCKTHFLLVLELEIKSKSGNWLHSKSVGTQWFEEERAAVDTRMDTNLAMMSGFASMLSGLRQ
jgi:hypothetical protein